VISAELVRLGAEAARAGRRLDAREIFLRVIETEPRNEVAWTWLTGLVDDLEDKIIACENVLTINPANAKVNAYLNTLLEQRAAIASQSASVPRFDAQKPAALVLRQPIPKSEKVPELLSQAEQLEHAGKIEEALQAYEQLAAKTRDSRTFDHVYRQIGRLEGLQREKIRFVSPTSSVLRMTFTWPLLYASFALIQIGLNPIAHLSFFLWISLLPLVASGSFLLALSEVRTRHAIWEKLFMEAGSGSRFARIVLAVAGWVFIIVPFALMLMNSLARLQNFQIPPEPFFR
jgi:tetratricopeptide (TPR) repeat protein